jgi:iron-sulfur cluster assembly protein
MFAEQNVSEGSLRLGVKGGGCSGLEYFLDVAREPAKGDRVFEQHGLRVLVDPKSYLYLMNIELDYQEGLLGAGFKFQNPNASRTCGCGQSFSA